MRRLGAKTAVAEEHARVPAAGFEQWQAAALRAYGLVVVACLAKIALNTAWYYGARGRVGDALLRGVGLVLFAGWIASLLAGWILATRARRRQAELGIVLGERKSEGR